MRIIESRLREMIREEISRLELNETSQISPAIQAVKSKLSAMNLGADITESVVVVKTLEGKIKSSLGIDSGTLGLLLSAALAISGRESSYGQGRRYQWTSWAETILSQYGVKDTSIGPTQVKYDANFGPGSDLADYGKQVGITSPASLSEYPKAIVATIGLLSKLYKKAVSLGYASAPGNASKPYKSTGSAALDLALIGYNMGESKVINYCGNETIKKPCNAGTAGIVSNYIPNFSDEGLTSLGYIGEVSTEMKKFAGVKNLF